MANVIEVLLRARDQTGPVLGKFKGALLSVRAAAGALAGAFALRALVNNISEAESATSKLDQQFRNTGRTSGFTRAALDGLNEELQNFSTQSGGAIKEAQALLLTFTRVRGDGFERTLKVAADLAAFMKTDLSSATRTVALALQDPERGLRGLRTAGVQFTESQKETIKTLVETGQVARAQSVILGELETRFKGAANAASNTLAGSIQNLKNSFSDLFEGNSEIGKTLAGAFNDVAKALKDPGIREGLDTLIAGLGKIVELAIKGAAALGNLVGSVTESLQGGDLDTSLGRQRYLRNQIDKARSTGDDPYARILEKQLDAEEFDFVSGSRRQGRYTRAGKNRKAEATQSVDGTLAAESELQEFRVTVQRISEEIPQFLSIMNEETKTEGEKFTQSIFKVRASIEAQVSEGLISRDVAEARMRELFPIEEIDINEIRAKYKSIKAETTDLGEFMKGVFSEVGRSIQRTFADFLFEGKFSFDKLEDIARRALSEIVSAILISGIKNALASQLAGGSGGSSSGFLNALVGIGSLIFGGTGKTAGAATAGGASGGRFSGMRIVGEEGPELASFGSSGRVYNKRTLQSMGFGGASVNYAPTTNVQIIERENPEETRQELFGYLELRLAKDRAEFQRSMSKSGLEVR